MRLGAYTATLSAGRRVSEIYGGATSISERRRHRYEVNIHYKERLANREERLAAGLNFSGMSPESVLTLSGARRGAVEGCPRSSSSRATPVVVGVQYHPELKSKPFDPHTMFASFIKAAVEQSRLV